MMNSVGDQEEQAADEARRWITRMASGEMMPDELARFRAWRDVDALHDRVFQENRAIWRAAAGPAGTGLSPVLGRPARARRRLPFGRPISPLTIAGVAAATVAGMVLADDLFILRADYRTGTTVRSIALADGSRAMLDADTAIVISYDEKERRIELLRGDAWFEVAHGDPRPFRVAALGGVTQDVGTAFEVRREKATVTVVVTQGQVEVRSPVAGQGLSLRASERARYAKGGAPVRAGYADPDTVAAWRRGEILFDRADMRSAIAAIGRYRSGPVFILGAPPLPRAISGAFRTDRPEEAIDAIAGMNGLSVLRFGGMALLRPIR